MLVRCEVGLAAACCMKIISKSPATRSPRTYRGGLVCASERNWALPMQLLVICCLKKQLGSAHAEIFFVSHGPGLCEQGRAVVQEDTDVCQANQSRSLCILATCAWQPIEQLLALPSLVDGRARLTVSGKETNQPYMLF